MRKKKWTLAISIPVHENQQVVINQIQNIEKYVPSSIIILHLSRDFEDSRELLRYIEMDDRVFLNPTRLESGWGNIMDAHISNFNFVKKNEDFEYFMFHASNDMYVLSGVESYITGYDAGFHIHKIYRKSRWWPGEYALEDQNLKAIMADIDAKEIVATQIEGSFYKKELFEQIVNVIDGSRNNLVLQDNQTAKRIYTKEEVYFSTIAYRFLQNKEDTKVGFPTTYSEVHDFDRMLWRLQQITWGIYRRLPISWLVPKSKYDELEKSHAQRLAARNSTALSISKIRNLINNRSDFLKKHSYLNDSVTKYRLYGNLIFSVKRVPRDMNNPIRIYINNL